MKFLAVGQTLVAIATFLDATQTPPVSDPLDKPAVWTVDDPTKVSLTVVQDGTAGNGDGVSTCSVTALADGAFNLQCDGVSDGVNITGHEAGTVGGDTAVTMSWQGDAPAPAADASKAAT